LKKVFETADLVAAKNLVDPVILIWQAEAKPNLDSPACQFFDPL